jgi:hypothetical protein
MQIGAERRRRVGRRSGPGIRHENGPYAYANSSVASGCKSKQSSSDKGTKEYHYANQTHWHRNAAGGRGCRCSDRRRTDGRGRTQPAPEDLRREAAASTCQSPGNVEINNGDPPSSFTRTETCPICSAVTDDYFMPPHLFRGRLWCHR